MYLSREYILKLASLCFSALLVLMFVFYNVFVNILGQTIFYAALIFLVFLVCTLTAYIKLRNQNYEAIPHSRKSFGQIIVSLIILLLIYCIAFFYDVAILHTRLFSIIIFSIGFMAILFYALRINKPTILVVLLAFFLVLVVSTYFLYPPAFGHDTWRDSVIASSIEKSGNIDANSYSAYPLPTIPVLYSIISLVLGFSVTSSSVLVGILYLLLLNGLVFMIAINLSKNVKTYAFSVVMCIMLILSIPLISVWIIWFIPEAFAIIMSLFLLLLLTSKTLYWSANRGSVVMLIFPFALSIVVGHGVISLWTIALFMSILVAMRLQRVAYSNQYSFSKMALIILGPLATTYFIYTTIIEPLTSGARTISSVLLRFLSLTSPATKILHTTNGSPFITALFSYGPIAICLVVALIAWLEIKQAKKRFDVLLMEVLFIYGVIGVIIGFLGVMYIPAATLDRYIMFESLILLIVVSSVGFVNLLKSAKIGKILTVIFATLLVISISFGGAFTPAVNLLNVKNTFAVESPPTWSDSKCIDTVSSFIWDAQITTDRSTGLPMLFSFANKNNADSLLFKTHYETANLSYSDVSIRVKFIGADATNASDVLRYISDDGLFVYRPAAFTHAFSLPNTNEEQMYDIMVASVNKVYSGTINVFA